LLANVTVYVVDDDDGVRDSLKILLESYGVGVEAFESTEAFLHGYQRKPHTCLVLDQHLPGSTGLDFLDSPAGAGLDLPVILVTGRGDANLEKRAIAAGCVAYLEKPIDDRALVAAIERAVANGLAG
jgi:two-component system response regulator FixJ